MKKESKKTTDTQLLELLKQVLPKAMPDPKMASLIYAAVEKELKAKNRAVSFIKFCQRVELPDLEANTVAAVQKQFSETFPDADVVIQTNRKEKQITVEVSLPDGKQFTNEIKVRPVAPEASDAQDIVLKFVPFPVCLPGDKEMVWLLAKRESMTPEEGGVALAKIQEDFWASKTGQKLIRDRVDRCFPEFIARAPAGMLTELGLKRHYKTPEPVKMLRPLSASK